MMRGPSWLGAVLLLLSGVMSGQSTVRFGVLGLFHPRVLEGTWKGPGALLVSAAGQRMVLNGETEHRRIAVRAVEGRVLVAGRLAQQMSANGRGGGDGVFELAVPGRFHRVYHGRLEITAHEGELVAVVMMDRETAVATIVASEMPRNAPLEALKAQAVVPRSFLSAGARHDAFDFCDTTHCQYLRSPEEVSRRVQTAVRDTEGTILTWRERPIGALYSSRCGGRTRSLREAGLDSGDGYPYYAVECRWCKAHPMHEPSTTKAGWAARNGHGPGAGHGIGMCQYGAVGMARQGADFRAILAHYYPNAELGGVR